MEDEDGDDHRHLRNSQEYLWARHNSDNLDEGELLPFKHKKDAAWWLGKVVSTIFWTVIVCVSFYAIICAILGWLPGDPK